MMSTSMAGRQGATPPAWLGRPRRTLLADVLMGAGRRWQRLRQLAGLLLAFVSPRLVRRRLERLRALGHVRAIPTTSQILVAARDQMILGATAETKLFYESQGIPWGFHNLRRVLSGPATMLDPAGLFSPRDTIIYHLLQTFHRHPVYDLVLLCAFPDGVEEAEHQAQQILDGSHPSQRALASLIEDGSYHPRLIEEIRAFKADPFAPGRPIPAGLVSDPMLMLAMEQFKDLPGFTNYAARLRVGPLGAIGAWLGVGWNVTLGALLHLRLGAASVRVECCDPDLVARHPPAS